MRAHSSLASETKDESMASRRRRDEESVTLMHELFGIIVAVRRS